MMLMMSDVANASVMITDANIRGVGDLRVVPSKRFIERCKHGVENAYAIVENANTRH